MDQLDLDISHYNLEDILNLFNVDISFGENELKNAKRMVLRTHPDKSKLDSYNKGSLMIILSPQSALHYIIRKILQLTNNIYEMLIGRG